MEGERDAAFFHPSAAPRAGTKRLLAYTWALRCFLAAIIVLVVLIAYSAYARGTLRGRHALERTRPRVSRVDGGAYRVHEGYTNPQEAADHLANISAWATELLRHLRDRYVRTPSRPETAERRAATEKLLQRFSPDNVVENAPDDPTGQTAFSTDKGAILAFCLRKKTGGREFHDPSLLLFVAAHELSHVAIDDVDHPPAFWKTFRWLLTEAEEAGLYRCVDYAQHPVNYCGLPVNYNPRWDPTLAPLQ